MKCPAVRKLLVTSDAPSPDATAHLAECAGCRAWRTRNEWLRAELAQCRPVPAAADFEERLLRGVRAELLRPAPPAVRFPVWLRAAAAAAVMIAAGWALRPRLADTYWPAQTPPPAAPSPMTAQPTRAPTIEWSDPVALRWVRVQEPAPLTPTNYGGARPVADPRAHTLPVSYDRP